jgi:hypothetical protein
MPETGAPGEGTALDELLEPVDLSSAPPQVKARAIVHRQTGGVIAAILQPPKSIE